MAQPLPTGSGKVEALSDVMYDVVTELYNCSTAVDALDMYIDDAKRENDHEALQAFQQMRQDELRHCEMLRKIIRDQVQQGTF